MHDGQLEFTCPRRLQWNTRLANLLEHTLTRNFGTENFVPNIWIPLFPHATNVNSERASLDDPLEMLLDGRCHPIQENLCKAEPLALTVNATCTRTQEFDFLKFFIGSFKAETLCWGSTPSVPTIEYHWNWVTYREGTAREPNPLPKVLTDNQNCLNIKNLLVQIVRFSKTSKVRESGLRARNFHVDGCRLPKLSRWKQESESMMVSAL